MARVLSGGRYDAKTRSVEKVVPLFRHCATTRSGHEIEVLRGAVMIGGRKLRIKVSRASDDAKAKRADKRPDFAGWLRVSVASSSGGGHFGARRFVRRRGGRGR